ncbi:MAG: glutamate synthase domain-containing protein 2 [Lentisphaeria bacterium]|jgi:glutamate synthase domain-containing protein 2
MSHIIDSVELQMSVLMPTFTTYQFIIEILVYGFVLAASFFVIAILWMYVCDKLQTKQAIRHNFPVIGRLRYLLEHWGTFFRQYFFALDREEMPFNRAQRNWVYRAAKNLDTTVGFGSSRNLTIPGTVFFTNGLYPVLESEQTERSEVIFGPRTDHPFHCKSFFNISAMSFGAISVPAVRALSRGAKLAGIWMNTGEGGLSPYHLEGGCDLVFQIGTGKFGVRHGDGKLSDNKLKELASLPAIKMFEIKLSQGAKPGKGGILPAIKVTEEIAQIRGIKQGEAAVSPNRFPEIEGPEDLLDMIDRVRSLSKKPTGIKLCLGNPTELESLCDAIVKRGLQSAPDFITIDSGDGGTGAAPMSLIDNVGMLVGESLPQVVDTLIRFGLRERVKVVASGKLINPVDVAWALCAGADIVNNSRGFMFALGCIQAMQCNKNTCPTGITTHNKRLQAGLNPFDKAQRVAQYANNIMKEVETIAHACGVKDPHQLNRHHVRIIVGNGKSVPYE